MRKRKVYEVDVVETEFPGFGVGYVDNQKVLIKSALPGQKVLAYVHKFKNGNAMAKVNEVVEEVDYKIDTACPVFHLCGGCSHQNVPYEKQLEFKKEQLLKLLNKANIENYEFLGMEGSPEIFEYRNKMEFSFGDFEKGGELTLGMHMKGKAFGIVNVECCKIVDEDFGKVLDLTIKYFREKEIKQYRVMSREGYLRNLVVRKGKNTGDFLVNIVTTSQLDFDMNEYKELLLGQDYIDKITGIIHTVNDSLSDKVYSDETRILYGRDYIAEKLLGMEFKISSLSFFQTNSKGAEKLYTIVKEFMGDAHDKTVFDLYCGTGTIGQIVAREAKKVVGVELIEEAVEAANENAKLNGLTNCQFIAGDVAKVIKDIDVKPDIIILDPPRPGVHPIAMEYVVKFDPEEIIYVSCNPKTLVNDLNVLEEAGYKVEKVQGMDMFPHTAHLECVVKIVKE
ncbi:23S rRNA (uracil(1939)-C(5))-methyltransferase RlmD [Clostridium sp. DL1XJH146]